MEWGKELNILSQVASNNVNVMYKYVKKIIL